MGAEAGLGDGANYGVAGESVQGRGRARTPEGGRHSTWEGCKEAGVAGAGVMQGEHGSRGDAGRAWEQGRE